MVDAERTGRFLVTLTPGTDAETLAQVLGLHVSTAQHGPGARHNDEVAWEACVCFERLGIAVLTGDEARLAQLEGLVADERTPLLAVEAEHRVHALEASWEDTGDDTWARRSVGAHLVEVTGEGVPIAVLDTGIDADHPDLAEAIADSESFVAGEPVGDGNGHGTHVAGAVAARPVTDGPAYGVAPAAALHVGKVLDDAGSGTDATVLDGIEWALELGCWLVSMSLGARWEGPGPYPAAYEQAAKQALTAGALLVAAAGNDSDRPDRVAPVSAPANCPSIVAVAAVDRDDAVAVFSNGTADGPAAVDLAAPGVEVASATAGGGRKTLSGTSMACPHATGVAALLAEAHLPQTPLELLALLHRDARRVTAASAAVGTGVAHTGARPPGG